MAIPDATDQSAISQRPSVPALLLLGGLLVLRFSLIFMPDQYTRQPNALTLWAKFVMVYGTLLLTALLIYVERRRLALFHIDRLGLALFLTVPVLVYPPVLMSTLIRDAPWETLPLTGALTALLPCAMLWLYLRLRRGGWLPQASRNIWRRAGLGLLVGVAVGAVSGYGSWWQSGAQGTLEWQKLFSLPFMALLQIGIAATLEEPLFRGFLWGYLRMAAWQERWILLFQGALFGVGHLYHIILGPLNFWVLVPISGLAFGWVAWRTRSIGASMLAHGVHNALGDILAHFRI